MSRAVAAHIVQWSPSSVSVYDVASRVQRSGRTLADVKQYIHGSAPVWVALSRRSTFIRLTRVPDLARNEIAQLLRVQAPQMFPIPAGEIAFDFAITQDVSPEGRLAVVCATRTDVLDAMRTAFRDQGVDVERVLPVALGSSVIAAAHNAPDAAIVQVEADGLTIDILQDGIIRYSRVCPAANDADQISAEVCRTFGIAKIPCSKIVAAGGLVFGEADLSVESSSLASLADLPAELTLNLEPTSVVTKRIQARVSSRRRLATLAVVAAIAAALLVGFDRGDLVSKARRVDSQRNAEARRIENIETALSTKLATEQRIADSLERAFKPAQRYTDILAVLGDSLPEDVWLNGVTLERGKDLLVRGTSKRNEAVSELVKALESSDRFRDVRLVFANNATIETIPVVQFSIAGHIVGNLPLVDKKVKRK